jgi:hypothetical protein
MNQNQSSLYGELVIPFQNEDESHIPDEISQMHDANEIMIEEAAYFIAEKRGFHPGYELEDWLKAEAQILQK